MCIHIILERGKKTTITITDEETPKQKQKPKYVQIEPPKPAPVAAPVTSLPTTSYRTTGYSTSGYSTSGYSTSGYSTTGYSTASYSTTGSRTTGSRTTGFPVASPPVIAPRAAAPPVVAPRAAAPPAVTPPAVAPPVTAPPVVGPPVAEIYYANAFGRFYGVRDDRFGYALEPLDEYPGPKPNIGRRESGRPAQRKRCVYIDMDMPPDPPQAHHHKRERAREVRLLEAPKDDKDSFYYFQMFAGKVLEADLENMEAPDGRGYATRELAIQAAYRQGFRADNSSQVVQVMPAKQGGYFVVGLAED